MSDSELLGLRQPKYRKANCWPKPCSRCKIRTSLSAANIKMLSQHVMDVQQRGARAQSRMTFLRIVILLYLFV